MQRQSERLLVRVGEEAVETTLAKQDAGVARCQTASGRVCASSRPRSIDARALLFLSPCAPPPFSLSRLISLNRSCLRADHREVATRAPITAVSGTLMVEAEAFKGDAKLKRWFDLALAHNLTMIEKEPNEKPKKKRSKQ